MAAGHRETFCTAARLRLFHRVQSLNYDSTLIPAYVGPKPRLTRHT